MSVVRLFSPSEAAAVSGIELKTVNNAIDKKIIATVAGANGTSRRALTVRDLLRLKLWHGVGPAMSADRRRQLFDEIDGHPAVARVRVDDFLIVDVGEARRRLKAGIVDLRDAEAAIHRVDDILGGEPVFKGTRIAVRDVSAMLAQGADAAELLEGYPSLTARMLDFARLWTTAHPQRGRPKTLAEQGWIATETRRGSLKPDEAPYRAPCGDAAI